MMNKIGSTLTGIIGGEHGDGSSRCWSYDAPTAYHSPPAISGSATAGTSGQWGPYLI